VWQPGFCLAFFSIPQGVEVDLQPPYPLQRSRTNSKGF
jgi:hypothetical protein